MANKKVEVDYRHIDTFAKVEYHHKFLLYTDKTGQRYTINGWTGEETSPQLSSDKIYIETGLPNHIGLLYDTNNSDNLGNRKTAWHKNADKEPISPQKQYRELIAEAPDLSVKWAEMVCSAQSRDNIYPYDYLRQNSNTLANTLLREASFPGPEKDGTFRYLALGSGNRLDRNLVSQHPDDADISDLEDLSYPEEKKFREDPQYTMQTQSKPVENLKPQFKYEETMAMLQGLLNDTDGSCARELLTDNPGKVASLNERVQQALEKEWQQQLAVREEQNIQREQQGGLSCSI